MRLGNPHPGNGQIPTAIRSLGAASLVSANAFYRSGRWAPISEALLRDRDVALDSAGFVAMARFGGYRWTVEEYVDLVVTSRGDGGMPFPWSWWAAMDYCVESEIAGDRDAVLERMWLTIEGYGDHLEAIDCWRHEGVDDVPDPMPVLQGRSVSDYLDCAHGIQVQREERGRRGLPELVGVGSMCRRPTLELIEVVEGLDQALPAHTRLHLFGVKGDALEALQRRFSHRVASVDSMAWAYRSRREARAARIPNDLGHQVGWLNSWAKHQQRRIDGARS